MGHDDVDDGDDDDGDDDDDDGGDDIGDDDLMSSGASSVQREGCIVMCNFDSVQYKERTRKT